MVECTIRKVIININVKNILIQGIETWYALRAEFSPQKSKLNFFQHNIPIIVLLHFYHVIGLHGTMICINQQQYTILF